MNWRMFIRAELIGRRGAVTKKFTLKRRSGKIVDTREIFELGFPRRNGVAVETLDCDMKVGFERSPSGNTGARTADVVMLAALSITEMVVFIFKLEAAVEARQFYFLDHVSVEEYQTALVDILI